MKKVISLSKVLCKDYLESLPIFGDRRKKTVFFWLITILNCSLVYLVYQILNLLNKMGIQEIFLYIYLMISSIIIMFEVSLATVYIYFRSKDIEYILPMPFKPMEILLAKYTTVLCVAYGFESIFLVAPLATYGVISANNISFLFWFIPIIVIFPIFITLIISILTHVVMQLTRIVRNKELLNIFAIIFIVFIVFLYELKIYNSAINQEYLSEQFQIFGTTLEEHLNEEDNESKTNHDIETEIANDLKDKLNVTDFKNYLRKSNEYLIVVNPFIDILTSKSAVNTLIQFFKIIIYNSIAFIVFVLIGKMTYMKTLLKNTSSVVKIGKKGKYKINSKKIKKRNKYLSYIEREIKDLIKNQTFLTQCIFPSILFLISTIVLLYLFYPIIEKAFGIAEIITNDKVVFDIEMYAVVLCLMQIVFTFSNLSLTAITRKGKNAIFIKYIPMGLYKQFIMLNVPQIIINNISIMSILIVIKYLSGISILIFLELFIISNMINLIYSNLTLIVDIRKPNLSWDDETTAIKQNKNTLFQYVLTILNIIFLIYMYNVLKELKISTEVFTIVLFSVYLIIFVTINIIIKKKEDKVFNKII